MIGVRVDDRLSQARARAWMSTKEVRPTGASGEPARP